MTYYYNKNNCNHEDKAPYTKKDRKDPTSNFHKRFQTREEKTDSLIIDSNTVYEVDEECIEKYLSSVNKKKE